MPHEMEQVDTFVSFSKFESRSSLSRARYFCPPLFFSSLHPPLRQKGPLYPGE